MIPTWGAAFGANAIFNSAEFRADLTHSAVPDKAAPGTTATFTRATTSTWTNNDGYMVTGVAGEIGFVGARRVYNLLPSSENLTVGFTATGSTLAAGSITESGATSGHYAQTTSMVIPATAIFIMQAEIKQSVGTRNIGIGTNSVGNAIFNPSTGVFVANDGATLDHGTGTQTADGYWPVWVKVQATTSNKPIISLYSGTTQSYAGDGASQVLVRKLQLEDVTAQTTQTAGEYVSVGVESAPYYHGSFVDGVKCFPTDLSGNPIPLTTLLGYKAEGARANLCLQSNSFNTAPWGDNSGSCTVTQNAIGPDGAVSAWTMTDDQVGNGEGRYASQTLTAATYTYSLFVQKETGTPTNYPVFAAFAPTGETAIITIDTVNGAANAWSAYTARTIASGLVGRCKSFNDDFWRVEMSFTGTAADWGITILPAGSTTATAANTAVSNAATGSAVFYGAQVELGSFASTYIPTTTAAVTRDADVLTYSGGDVPNLKTLMAGFRCAPGVNTGAARVVASLSPGASNFAEYIDAGSFQLGATDFWFQGIDNSVAQWTTQCSNTYTPGTSAKAASSWATNDIKMSFNGVAQTADTVATMPTVTTLYVGSGSGIVQLNGNVGPIYGWTRNLSQSEVNAVAT